MHARGVFATLAFKKLTHQSLFLATVFIFVTIISIAIPRFALAQGPPDWVADELLVGLRPGVSQARAQAIYHAHGAAFIDEIPRINTHIIRVPAHALDTLERALSHRPEFEFVEKNRLLAPVLIPDDQYYYVEWHLPHIGAPAAWDLAVGSMDVIVAILDTGVDTTHPDLKAKIVDVYNTYDNNTDVTDVTGHGTMVAGAATAISNNAIGVASTGFDALLMPIRVTNDSGYATFSSIAAGLIRAKDHGAMVMNLSFEGIARSSTITSAAEYVVNNGGVVFAAAGNCGCLDETAENPYIISVSATWESDELTAWSSRGNYIDIAAPGERIYTTKKGGGFGISAGTSISSPVAAGVAALMLSVNPDLTAANVEALLETTAVDLGAPGVDTSFGHGRVDAHKAVLAAAGFTTPPDTTPPSVSIVSPADGETVLETVSINVAASDNTSIETVALYLDGMLFAIDAAAPFTFGWDTTQVADGLHKLQAVASDAAGNSTDSDVISVTVQNYVPDTSPPSVAITFPVDGATLSGTVNVSVSAADDVGVTEVELYLDGQFLTNDRSAPFSFSWDTSEVADGLHKLQAVASDSDNSTDSETINVIVKNLVQDTSPPTAAVIFPANGATVSGTISVSVSATDDVKVTQVELYLDGELLGSDSTAPFIFVWDSTRISDGTHTLQAVASDAAGNSADSAVIVVKVQNAASDTTPPTVFIASPAGTDTVSKVVKITVEASDDVQVQQVDFLLDGSVVRSASCSTTTCTVRFNWNTRKETKGSHDISAVAYDTAGNTGAANPVTLFVK
jgi:thermitase